MGANPAVVIFGFNVLLMLTLLVIATGRILKKWGEEEEDHLSAGE